MRVRRSRAKSRRPAARVQRFAFMKNTLKRHGSPERITNEGVRSYGAAMNELGNREKQEMGRWTNNRVENSHLPFRRRERAMARFSACAHSRSSPPSTLRNHFSLERHLVDRQTYKERRSAALARSRFSRVGPPPQRSTCIVQRAVHVRLTAPLLATESTFTEVRPDQPPLGRDPAVIELASRSQCSSRSMPAGVSATTSSSRPSPSPTTSPCIVRYLIHRRPISIRPPASAIASLAVKRALRESATNNTRRMSQASPGSTSSDGKCSPRLRRIWRNALANSVSSSSCMST